MDFNQRFNIVRLSFDLTKIIIKDSFVVDTYVVWFWF